VYKKVIYIDRRDGQEKAEWFQVKGTMKPRSVIVDRTSEADALKFMEQEHVEYLASTYHMKKSDR